MGQLGGVDCQCSEYRGEVGVVSVTAREVHSEVIVVNDI